MFCSNCGEENRNDRKFCANCGNPLKDYTKPTPKEDLLMTQDVIEANKKQAKTKKTLIVCRVLSFAMLILACACVIFSNFVFKDNKTLQVVLSSVAIGLTVLFLILASINAKIAKKIKQAEKE